MYFLSRYINIILINLRAVNTNAFSLIFLSVALFSHVYLFLYHGNSEQVVLLIIFNNVS